MLNIGCDRILLVPEIPQGSRAYVRIKFEETNGSWYVGITGEHYKVTSSEYLGICFDDWSYNFKGRKFNHGKSDNDPLLKLQKGNIVTLMVDRIAGTLGICVNGFQV